MSHKPTIIIPGSEKGVRVDSRVLEERIQKAVADGHRNIEIIAQGQHGIGGRLWRAGNEPISLRILGTSGQRVGAMGFPNTLIDVVGPASDDVGWLNAGARIIVRGNATNGVGNAMAQGKIYVAGDIGARGMTMTKHNPRFDPPELWVLGSVGDSFAEFMAGGVAVICGFGTAADGQHPRLPPLRRDGGGKDLLPGSPPGIQREGCPPDRLPTTTSGAGSRRTWRSFWRRSGGTDLPAEADWRTAAPGGSSWPGNPMKKPAPPAGISAVSTRRSGTGNWGRAG